MGTPKINFIKSCKAKINMLVDSNRNDIVNIELLRYHKIESGDHKLVNNYFYDLLMDKNFKINYEYNYLLCGNVNKIFICETELNNVTRVMKYADKKLVPEEFNQLIGDIDNISYICKITDTDTINPNKVNIYPKYFLDNLYGLVSVEKQFLIDNNITEFSYSNTELIILPELSGMYPITTQKIMEWNTIKTYIMSDVNKIIENQDIILSFLSNIRFVLFLKSGMPQPDGTIVDYKYQDIFSLLDHEKTKINENINLLKKIKTKICNFYETQLFIKDIDPNMIEILINTDNRYKFIAINFKIYDPYFSHHYTSFIDAKRSLRLDDVIATLESKLTDKPDKLLYMTRINEKDANVTRCNDNLYWKSQLHSRADLSTNWRRQSGGDIQYRYSELVKILLLDKFKILFGLDSVDKSQIKILNEYNKGNHNHSYCSEFFVVQIADNIYEVSVKSITYKILNDVKKNKLTNTLFIKFAAKFWNKLNTIIREKSNPMIEYKYLEHVDAEQIYLFNKLPSMLEIYVKKIEKYTPETKVYLTETSLSYKTYVEPKIKKSHIDLSIILHLLWKSEFRKIYKLIPISTDHHKLHSLFILNVHTPISDYVRTINTYFNNNRVYLTSRMKSLIHNFCIFTKKMIANAYLGSFIMDRFIFTDNFIFGFRMYDNNLKVLLHVINLIINNKLSNISKSNVIELVNKILCNNANIYDKSEGIITFIRNFSDDNINSEQLFAYLFEYIKSTSKLHILWYTPDIYIINYPDLFNLLDSIDIYKFVDINKKTYTINYNNNYNILYDYGRSLTKSNITNNMVTINNISSVSNISNFYKLYRDSSFIHNIRGLNDSTKVEIDMIINKLYSFRKNILNLVDTSLHISAHYPNLPIQNIFHMHVYNNNYGKIEEKLNNLYDRSVSRALMWDKNIKYTDYSNKDIVISYSIPLSENMTLKLLMDKLTKYLVESGRDAIDIINSFNMNNQHVINIINSIVTTK